MCPERIPGVGRLVIRRIDSPFSLRQPAMQLEVDSSIGVIAGLVETCGGESDAASHIRLYLRMHESEARGQQKKEREQWSAQHE
jgi:hypothetical protein